MNDYYMDRSVQFDDSSTRMQVMKEWGYKTLFTGTSAWADLPKHVALKRGNYIVDIPGHTVQVTVKKDMPKNDTVLTKLSQYFETHSELDNYDQKDELQQPVNLIWQKS